MKIPFQTVYFDVVGTCNARCSYCLTGSTKCRSTVMIGRDKFSEVLEKLVKGGLADSRSVLGLYNWGEPLLHPDLLGLVEMINKYGLRCSLSTNGSIVPNITKAFVQNLDHLIFSMPGFSQKAYDRISKLEFGKVCQNIRVIVKRLHEVGYKGQISISYHLYRFNLEEMSLCSEFAQTQGILFNPYNAILNDWYTLQKWVGNSLPQETAQKISGELFCDNIRQLMAASPSGYSCPQWGYLVINENADVVTCCQLPPHESEYLCGNVCKDPVDRIIEQKEQRPVCKGCINSGLAYYLNNSLVTPEWYTEKQRNERRVTILSLWLDFRNWLLGERK